MCIANRVSHRQDSRKERNLSYHIGGAHFGKY